MKIINIYTEEVIANIIGGSNLTLDEACALAGIEFIDEANGVYPENGQYYEDLDIVMD